MPDGIQLLAVMGLSEPELTTLAEKYKNNPGFHKALMKKAKESGFDFWISESPTADEKKKAFSVIATYAINGINDISVDIDSLGHLSNILRNDEWFAEMYSPALDDSGEI